MKSFQFTVCITDDEGYNIEINGLLTPIVQATKFYDAIAHPDVVKFCEDNLCRIYKQVGK